MPRQFTFCLYLTGLSGDGIHLLVKKAIEGCEEAVQLNLWNNIVLSSGTTKFPGAQTYIHRVKKRDW